MNTPILSAQNLVNTTNSSSFLNSSNNEFVHTTNDHEEGEVTNTKSRAIKVIVKKGLTRHTRAQDMLSGFMGNSSKETVNTSNASTCNVQPFDNTRMYQNMVSNGNYSTAPSTMEFFAKMLAEIQQENEERVLLEQCILEAPEKEIRQQSPRSVYRLYNHIKKHDLFADNRMIFCKNLIKFLDYAVHKSFTETLFKSLYWYKFTLEFVRLLAQDYPEIVMDLIQSGEYSSFEQLFFEAEVPVREQPEITVPISSADYYQKGIAGNCNELHVEPNARIFTKQLLELMGIVFQEILHRMERVITPQIANATVFFQEGESEDVAHEVMECLTKVNEDCKYVRLDYVSTCNLFHQLAMILDTVMFNLVFKHVSSLTIHRALQVKFTFTLIEDWLAENQLLLSCNQILNQKQPQYTEESATLSPRSSVISSPRSHSRSNSRDQVFLNFIQHDATPKRMLQEDAEPVWIEAPPSHEAKTKHFVYSVQIVDATIIAKKNLLNDEDFRRKVAPDLTKRQIAFLLKNIAAEEFEECLSPRSRQASLPFDVRELYVKTRVSFVSEAMVENDL